MLALLWVACGSGEGSLLPQLTIEPLTATPTPVARAGKQAAPPAAVATATAVPAPEPTDPPAESGDADVPAPPPAPSPTPGPPTATPEPTATAGPPSTGRWIDVDVTSFAVRLMDGTSVVQEIGPVGVGVQIDTGVYESTQTGLFRVHTKIPDLTYDAPYNTYISHWVGFDSARDNGFHSFLKDAQGNVVDASTGRVSNGCIRVGEIEAVFAYAEIGMPVYVHL